MDTSRDAIVLWCREFVADLLQIPLDDVDAEVDFDHLGIDSALAVSLLTEVEERYDVDIAPDQLFENPNLAALASSLHEQIQRRVAP